MKLHALLTLLIASALLMAADAQTTTFKNTGAFASSNFPNINFFVGSGDLSTNNALPFLDYSVFTANSDGSYTYGYGYGNIPKSAFTANNVQHMSLDVDTSQVAGFQSMSCTEVFQPTYSYSCTAGPYGVIQLNWQQNGYSSSTTKQTLGGTNGNVSTSMSSDSSYASANASGTFLGTAVADNQSEIGTDKNRDITITIGN